MTFEEFDSQISALLKMLPNGTVAELTDCEIAWWNGDHMIYAWIGECCTGYTSTNTIPQLLEFDPSDDWRHFQNWFVAWIAAPQFSCSL